MKETIKSKLENLQVDYNQLSQMIREYLKAIAGRKRVRAFYYKKTEQPPAVHGNAEGPKQFNIIQVKELIDQVMTAKQLGFITVLDATPDQLELSYVQEYPDVPIKLRYL